MSFLRTLFQKTIAKNIKYPVKPIFQKSTAKIEEKRDVSALIAEQERESLIASSKRKDAQIRKDEESRKAQQREYKEDERSRVRMLLAESERVIKIGPTYKPTPTNISLFQPKSYSAAMFIRSTILEHYHPEREELGCPFYTIHIPKENEIPLPKPK